jgi:hypothetical protein
MDANQTQQFIGRLVPVYQRHFTADELDGLLKFYRSPLGQKVINEMPTTMAEANQAGQQWSEERSQQMIAELKHMGSLDASGRCPAKTPPPALGAAATGGALHEEADDEGAAEEAHAKPAVKPATHSKAAAKTPVKKVPAKPAPKKTTTPAKSSAAKTPAKTAAKPESKAPAKANGATKPASTPSSTQGG